MPIGDFDTHAIGDAVTKASHEQHNIEMSREESVWLADLLVNPPAPDGRMTAAVERYTQLIRSDVE